MAGTKPAQFEQILNCKAISGITTESDTIDVTPLESSYRRYVAGLIDTGGGSWPITFGLNDDLITKWERLRTASETARESSLSTWAEVLVPGMQKACFMKIQMGAMPLSDIAVSSALEVEITCVLNDFVGWEAKVAMVEKSADGSTIISG